MANTKRIREGYEDHEEHDDKRTSKLPEATSTQRGARASRTQKAAKAAGKEPGKACTGKQKEGHILTQNGGNRNPYWNGHCGHFSFKEIPKQGHDKCVKDGKDRKYRGGYSGGEFNGKHVSRGIPRRSC